MRGASLSLEQTGLWSTEACFQGLRVGSTARRVTCPRLLKGTLISNARVYRSGLRGSLHLDGGALVHVQVASIRQGPQLTMGTSSGLEGGEPSGGGSGGKLISSKPENAGSSFSGLGVCVRTSCSSLAGCDKSQESRVDSGEPDSWPLDSSRSPSVLVLLVSSPRFGACVQGSGAR
ncbi:hypothetical protein MRX96_028512 [Rhipicephalus microplus]